MEIRDISFKEHIIIKDIVRIHLSTFRGFFLTFMGRGFLTCLYKSFCMHKESGVLVAFENELPIGFLAYSGDYSGLFKFMIRKKLIPFAWFSFLAFIRKPKIFIRLLRAFYKSNDVKRSERYVELSSIGVKPDQKSKGIGSSLISTLKKKVDFSIYSYISLETDAKNNDSVNRFYLNNGFILERTYENREGRLMNEYRYMRE